MIRQYESSLQLKQASSNLPILSTAIVLILVPVMPATRQHHYQAPASCEDDGEYGKHNMVSKASSCQYYWQVPEACQDEGEYGKYKKKDGLLAMALILDDLPYFFRYTPAATYQRHCEPSEPCEDEE
ncbi:hypothetical protein K492DRAFT_200882 [Lichtheimia hyalospora FSU 10163]|nr:hypothetical protein K492DRAFT_200882 [Lichtheimia hyalospora FSU 10163]